MSTKSELIAEITSFYDYIGTPQIVISSDTHIPAFITTYSVIVYETGLSEKSKKPVLKSKYVDFIVYNEGEVDEAAYYSEDELKNDVDTDVTGDDSLLSISKIYDSSVIRKKIRSAIMNAAQAIFSESIPASDMTASANVGQKIVNVEDGSLFSVGQEVLIADAVTSETNTIADIVVNQLTMVNNLAHTYTTGNNGYVSSVNNDDRRLWAANALLDPDKYTLAMTAFVALDSTVQSSGNDASDSVFQTIVNNNITKLASASRIV